MLRHIFGRSGKEAGKKRIYLDHASLTPIDPAVQREVNRYSSEKFMNPSSIHAQGTAAGKALLEARHACAALIGAHADEIVFAGSGTEANNLAILGAARNAAENQFLAGQLAGKKPHVIVSAIEHASVLKTAIALHSSGAVELSLAPVDANGVVILSEFKKLLCKETVLVSIMMTNNEIGTIQPIRETIKAVRHHRKTSGLLAVSDAAYPLVHTDACQAALYEKLDMEKLGVDMLTLDAHKVFGPRGIGMLYVRRKTPVSPIIYGGDQERGLRSGTENIPGIMGFAHALKLAAEMREKETARMLELRDYFAVGLRRIDPAISINAENADRTPHILNVSIPGIDAEFFILQLDAAGISCSTKSSCLSMDDESYVLSSIGIDSKSSVRFSFGRTTTKDELKQALAAIDYLLKKSL
ncbi:MAG: hypothetical protein JWO73_567 [Candidatus Taylorbacteria bacterium]|nr:hypothetical protein [Candidatus Taylorbacteria bacterium]